MGKKLEKALSKRYTDLDCLEGLWTLLLEVLKDGLERHLLNYDYSWYLQQETGLENHNFLATNLYDLMLSKAIDLFTQLWMKLRLPKT